LVTYSCDALFSLFLASDEDGAQEALELLLRHAERTRSQLLEDDGEDSELLECVSCGFGNPARLNQCLAWFVLHTHTHTHTHTHFLFCLSRVMTPFPTRNRLLSSIRTAMYSTARLAVYVVPECTFFSFFCLFFFCVFFLFFFYVFDFTRFHSVRAPYRM
jgi:hypothetical protein